MPRGDEVVPVLNRWLGIEKLLKAATRDWHPRNHCSFKENGGPWPAHCVQGTLGAEFHPDLRAERVSIVVSKATSPDQEAYSGFDAPRLLEELKESGIRRLWCGGLATDYCAKATVLDARKLGFEVFVIEDAIRGIDATPGDVDAARREMESAGAAFVRTDEVLGPDRSPPSR